MSSSPIFLFPHIPKTAGTTLTHLLQKHCGKRFLAVDNRGKWVKLKRSSNADSRLASNNDYLPQDFRQDLKRFPHVRVLTGHSLKPYIELNSSSKELVWFTFLRNPEARFVSHYIHQQTSNQVQYQMPLVDWCRKFHRNDFMVRMIAGEENLDKAIDILERKFRFVGISECFDESMRILKEELQLEHLDLDQPAHCKMKGRDDSLKNEIYGNYEKYRDCVLENNQLDTQLYDYAKRRFSFTSTAAQKSLPTTQQIKGFEFLNLIAYRVQNNLVYKLRKRDRTVSEN